MASILSGIAAMTEEKSLVPIGTQNFFTTWPPALQNGAMKPNTCVYGKE